MSTGHGEKLSRKQEQAIAALLEESSIQAAAVRARVGERTLRNWLQLPAFGAAYRRARRNLVEGAIGRIQAATGQAVDTLLAVARDGAKDSDRVRAAVALLDHAFRGIELADVFHADPTAADANRKPIEGTSDVVKVLADRLRQVDAAALSTGEKSRLTATLADALLRAIGVDVLGKRLEALQAVLTDRKDKKS
jgi:hypothetical protein